MKKHSNQRITKIKRDVIEELLKKAEGMDVKDGVSVQPIGSDLVPYPDMNNLRLWTRDYLLKGINKVYPVKFSEDGETYLTTILDGLPFFTKLSKTLTNSYTPNPVTYESYIASFITPVQATSKLQIDSNFNVSFPSTSTYLKLPNNNIFKNNNTFTFSFTTGSDVTTLQRIYHCEKYITLEINAKGLIVYTFDSVSPEQTLLAHSNLQPNTKYIVTINISDGNYVTAKIFNADGTQIGSTLSIGTDGIDFNNTAYSNLIGVSSGDGTNRFLGTVHLAECSIDLQTGYLYSIASFVTVVGSPTITPPTTSSPHFSVSGFSSSKYLKLPNNTTYRANNTYTFTFSLNDIETYQTISKATNFLSLEYNPNNDIGLYTWNFKNSSPSVLIPKPIIQPNTKYKVVYTIHDSNHKTVQAYLNDTPIGNLVEDQDLAIDFNYASTGFYLGLNDWDSTGPFLGSIYLDECSVSLNGAAPKSFAEVHYESGGLLQFVTRPDESSSHLLDFLTPVGNITIDEHYNASNFSSSNYIELPNNCFYRNYNTYIMSFTTGSDISTAQSILKANSYIIIGLASEFGFAIWNSQQNKIITFVPFNQIEPNTKYKIIATVYNNSGYTNLKVEAYKDGVQIGITIDNRDTQISFETFQSGTIFSIGTEPDKSQPFKGTIHLSECSVKFYYDKTVPFAYLYQQSVPETATSKPGLWLSNLSTPISNSFAGAWLRQNLIHNNEDKFTSINSDIIGNYSYSFLQRGIIYEGTIPEDPGAFDYPVFEPDSSDSFNLHWSPSIAGCIATPSLSIENTNYDNPDYRFGNSYTAYQTIVTPSNPDMQTYEETESKYHEFQFTKNVNAQETTWYSMRSVGTDWSYELKFTPNKEGTGAGTGSNESNGGCTTGYLKYYNELEANYCTQEVNECFVTDQYYFNADNPNTGSVPPLDTNNINVYSCRLRATGKGTNLIGEPIPFKTYNYALTTVTDGVGIFSLRYEGGTFYSTASNWYGGGLRLGTGYCCSNGCVNNVSHHNFQNCGTCSSSNYCGAGILTAYTWDSSVDPTQPQENVDIYLNITDLKCQYETQGIPWNEACTTNRFQLSYSTSPSTELCTVSKLIAKDVDINSSGDVSQLNEITLSK